MSARYIVIISKCLAELSIKNMNLLTGLQERLLYFLQKDNEAKPLDEDEKITCDELAQVINNFVKLKFIDNKNYLTLERLFFQKMSREQLNNKHSLFTILSAHFIYFKTSYTEITKQKNYSKENEKDTSLKKRRQLL